MTSGIYLKEQFFNSILSLSTNEGINASGKDDVYGCIFGRDSAITILKLLHAISKKTFSKTEEEKLYEICRRALLTLCNLQGKRTNIESGEKPGKFIHEFRKDNIERLLTLEKPWYVYPDGILRNYDSIDSTPLALIALFKFWQATHDAGFLLTILPAVERGLNWIISYGDLDKDYLLEYELPLMRKHGGLPVQSWTDSYESLLTKNGKMPNYPIAPVEVQGYAWLALKLWADFYAAPEQQYLHTRRFSQKLLRRAEQMKKAFNKSFILHDNNFSFAAQALDGDKNQITTITGNPMILLWATYHNDGKRECILEEQYIADFVTRAFCPDLFDADAGIRTMSSLSPTFDPTTNSYHNGSFWPKLNGLIHEGLLNWNYKKEADLLKDASLKPLTYFNTPIELYIKSPDGSFSEWENSITGQKSCREQAWSAAVGLDLLS